MSIADETAWLDATAQAELVRKKEVTPAELVEGAIARIERLNPQLNAVVLPLYEQARTAVKGALPDGPFRGVPFLLKDLLASYAGARMTSGTAIAKDYVATHDSVLVERQKAAGLVHVGKTNTPELGIVCTTESRLLGAAKNPWDPTRTTGGSSGGSAAAVAAGIVPMAHANDGGGSIRIPAACCGLFGFKPTRGRITLAPDYGDINHGFVSEHAVTRSVRDSAALLDATQGNAPGDPYYAPPPVRSYLAEVTTSPGRLRIGLVTKSATGTAIDPQCVAAVRDAAKLCESLGHEVTELDPQIDADALQQAFIGLWAGGVTYTVDSLARLAGKKPSADLVEPLTWTLYEMGKGMNASSYLHAHGLIQLLARQITAAMSSCDVWMSPTCAEPPVPLGTFKEPEGFAIAALLRAAAFCPFTPVCNVTGVPAMSVPLAWSTEGLPIGIHFAGQCADEATLFRLAGQLEQARPWSKRRPRIAA